MSLIYSTLWVDVAAALPSLCWSASLPLLPRALLGVPLPTSASFYLGATTASFLSDFVLGVDFSACFGFSGLSLALLRLEILSI
jgi:hypothetical protein